MVTTIAEILSDPNDHLDGVVVVGVIVAVNMDTMEALIKDESVPEPSCVWPMNDCHRLNTGDLILFQGLQVISRNIQDSVAHFRPSIMRLFPAFLWKNVMVGDVPMNRLSSLIALAEMIKVSFLPQSRCRKRRLPEIQSPGLLSHVVVTIKSVDTEAGSPPSLSTRACRHRRRRQGRRSTLTFAVLSDSQTQMVWLGCHLWQEDLTSRLGQRIQIHYLLSRRHHDSDDSIVLVGTALTCISSLGEENEEAMNEAVHSQQNNTGQSDSHQTDVHRTTLRGSIRAFRFPGQLVDANTLARFTPEQFVGVFMRFTGNTPSYRSPRLNLQSTGGREYHCCVCPNVMKVLFGNQTAERIEHDKTVQAMVKAFHQVH